MVNISGGRSPHQVWGLPGEPQSLPTLQVHNWREGWVGILWSHPPLEISSLPLVLHSFVLTWIFIHSPFLLFLSFLFFPSFFSHPVTMGDAVIDRVSLWVLSLVSRVQHVHITIWVLLCRNQQVILYHSPDISLIAAASFLCPLCSWQIVRRDSPHRRDFQVSFCTDWMRRTNKVDTVYIRYPAVCSEWLSRSRVSAFLTLHCANTWRNTGQALSNVPAPSCVLGSMYVRWKLVLLIQ